ncbi:unnamed protein product [Phytophthora lilii]|uniref:Unnamed protein product n=1 Tax=Phytophthora lilii TaxID=2077276 RepID=A0A9W6TQ20_9STRA|nr:unnamed protein product [Phytophthora lilii]
MGASAKEECQAPDNRLLDQPTENLQFWKPINFAATVKVSLDEAHASFEERSALVEYLLKEPDSLPDDDNAAHDCKEKIQMHFPLLLPLFIRVEDETRHKDDYTEAEELYYKNKQLKTALHVAVEHSMPDICMFLIAQGADITASCQNLETPSKEVWHTPLYTALWSAAPKYEIIEILLSTPQSIAKPRNPKLSRSIRYEPGQGPDIKWNNAVLDQLLKVHPSALPLFLDHYAIEVNRINGEKVFRFIEVRLVFSLICDHLEQIVNPTGTLTPSLSSKKTIKNAAVTHPVVRNAIHLKWELFGASTHRKQLSLYVMMVTFFYLSNLLLPKMEIVTDEEGKKRESMHKWIEFDSIVDYFVGVTKICCWGLAIYHLLYVEFFKEWRSNPKQYWRSVWNFLDVFTAMRIVFLTTFGELNYGDNYSFDDTLRARNYLAFLLLTAYVIVVIVVAMNLLIALMTSEYEKVRAQAKELSLLELAGALHRYEQWLGYSVVRNLYSTPKGQDLLNQCVLRVPGSSQQRRIFYRRELTSSSMSSSFSGSTARPATRYDARGTQRSKIDVVHFPVASAGDVVDEVENASLTEAISTQIMKHVHEEVEALRMQVTAELQDVREMLETAQQGNIQAQKDVGNKLNDVLTLLASKDKVPTTSSPR